MLLDSNVTEESKTHIIYNLSPNSDWKKTQHLVEKVFLYVSKRTKETFNFLFYCILARRLLWYFWGEGIEEKLNNFSSLSFPNIILNLVLTLNDLIIGTMEFVWRELYNGTGSHPARIRNCMEKDLFFKQTLFVIISDFKLFIQN